MWTNKQVYEKLKEIKNVRGRRALTQQIIDKCLLYDTNVSPELKSMVLRCEQEEERVDAWLALLTKEERFIIQTHLIDGLDWVRTIVECEQKWGVMNGRSERTLKRIQARALKRIVDCANLLEEKTQEDLI